MEGHNIVRLWRRARSCAWPGPGSKDADGWKPGLDAEMITDKLDSLTTTGSSLQFSGWHVDTALLPASPAKGTGRANERQSQVTGGSWVSWWQYVAMLWLVVSRIRANKSLDLIDWCSMISILVATWLSTLTEGPTRGLSACSRTQWTFCRADLSMHKPWALENSNCQ